MGYKSNSLQGELPESGAIFMSNVETHKECLERKLFGLPSHMSNFVLHVKEGMTLFLFEFEKRLLYGVYRATCDGEINIDPKAFRSSGKHFPAQVRFTTIFDCSPLAEHEFKDVIKGNYFSGKKFKFGLNEKQVRKLMRLFRSKEICKPHPERNIRRYDDKPSERNARSGDLRKQLRHRIRFDSCDSSGDEVKEEDDNMYINKHIIESRHKDKREGFFKHYTTESDVFGDSGRHDILGKHLDLREKHIEDGYIPVFSKPDFRENEIEDGYMPVSIKPDFREKDVEDGYIPVFSKPHRNHVDEIIGRSDFLMDGNKDIDDYNRLQDEYKVREAVRGSLNEHMLTKHVFSPFNQSPYSNYDPTRINVPDIQLSPCFNDGSGFIPIADNRSFFPSSVEIPMSKSLPYYSHDEGSTRYLDDSGSQSSIFPKFISRNLSSDAGLRVHERDPTDNDYRFCEKHESKHTFGTADKRVSVFSRLRRQEQASETDENPVLSSSVDNVMKMLEKVARSPKKRRGKSMSAIKQDDADNLPDSKIEGYELPDVNMEVDADMAHEEAEGESAYQETRLMDFKRRRKLNKRTNDASKENYESLVDATSDVGPVLNDQITATSHKRRKLVRPAFIKKNLVPDSASAHENTLPTNDSADVALESSEKVIGFIKSMVPTCHESTPDDSSLTKAGSESSKKVGDHENTRSANDSADVALESSTKVDTSDDTTRKAESESSMKVDVSVTHSANENTRSANDDVDVAFESSEKVDAFNKSMVQTCDDNTPTTSTKAESESLKKVDVSMKHNANENDDVDVAFESSEKIDAFNKSMVQQTCHDNTPTTSTKAESENLKKVDVSIKSIDLNMLPTSDESSPSKDDDNSTQVILESQKSGNGGNAESCVLSDAFVEGTTSKDDQKMCGWIKW